MRLSNFFTRFLAVIVMGFSAVSYAGHDTETDANGVILAGHDAVAYFTQGKPVEGRADITSTYQGAIYRFANTKTEINSMLIRLDMLRSTVAFVLMG